jgi:hypothetical protein
VVGPSFGAPGGPDQAESLMTGSMFAGSYGQ